MAEPLRIVLTGGVSGGHTFPLIAVAERIAAQTNGNVEFLFIGPKGRFGAEAMEERGIPVKLVSTGKLRRYFSLQNFIDPFLIPWGFVESLWYLYRFLPDAVFSKGGSASVPAVLAAWLYRIPILIHDSDAVAGMANKFMSHFATKIAIAYPTAREFFPDAKVALTGNPVRTDILDGSRERGYQELSLDPSKKTLFVIGGSLGATKLNEAVLQILPQLLKENIQVVHQTGEEHLARIENAVKEYGITPGSSGYVPKAFLSGALLGDVYALADIVISRAGAGSIAELAAHGKTCILVPLPSAANDEQKKNAYAIAHIGGASVLEEPNLSEHILLQEIHELLADEARSKQMGEAIRAFYHKDAAEMLAQGVLSMIKQ
ncbi:MAG: undecaprenyldiphospho-muramoylpentapeptide beta-N-acetylglucosaminyltransferase [Patescibacteria group bacterium]